MASSSSSSSPDGRPPMRLPSLSKLTWLQGSPADVRQHGLKCMLLFQANCPGCHTHAIPTANRLWVQQSKTTTTTRQNNFDLYAVSTAFEDFALNTADATRLLLRRDGRHVGEAKARLGARVRDRPQMPVAYDVVVAKDEAASSDGLVRLALEATKYTAYDQIRMQQEQQHGRQDVGLMDMLERTIEERGKDLLPEYVAECFYAVRAMGTPTWVLHDVHGNVLDTKFGQQTEQSLLAWMEQVRAKNGL